MIKRINDKDFIFILCQKVVQPIGALYVGALSWQSINKIALVHPRIFLGYDDKGDEIYAGIQRELSPERQKEISKYITDVDATFPTAILLNIPIEKVLTLPVELSNVINFEDIDTELIDKEFSSVVSEIHSVSIELTWLIFPYREGIAQIIDGQHRMSGFKDALDDFLFDLPVTFFFNQDIAKQAEMFAIINGKQTRVTPSLVYDLFGISPQRSPYTVASKVVKLLNESAQSPLKQSIKILGKSNTSYIGSITQSAVAKIIIDLMCGDAKQAEEDKRLLRRKESLPDLPTMTSKKAVLRRYFITEKDEVVFKVLLNFFIAVEKVFPIEWTKPDSVLKKTIGFTALTRVMSLMIEEGLKAGDLSESYFTDKLSPFSDINFDSIQLSSKGIKQLVDLLTVIN